MRTALLVLLIFSPQAFAHASGEWNSAQIIVFTLSALSAVYIKGWLRIRSRAIRSGIARLHLIAFVIGIVTLVAALLTPIDSLSDKLAWVHMLQHTLLMLVAAPLIAVAAPSMVSNGNYASLRRPPLVCNMLRR